MTHTLNCRDHALDCPDCGERPAMVEFRLGITGTAVKCFVCKQLGPVCADMNSAVKAWNHAVADQAVEASQLEDEAALWRIAPDTHTIPCELNNFATPDPFEGPGETYPDAYRRVVAENLELRTALHRAAIRLTAAEATQPDDNSAEVFRKWASEALRASRK